MSSTYRHTKIKKPLVHFIIKNIFDRKLFDVRVTIWYVDVHLQLVSQNISVPLLLVPQNINTSVTRILG